MTTPTEDWTLKGVIPTESSRDFHQQMVNRMNVSYHKYGAVKDAIGKVDCIESALQRIEKYLETGNTEWLPDAANFLMMESMGPQHANAHFRATDSHESPGRKRIDGRTTSKENLDLDPFGDLQAKRADRVPNFPPLTGPEVRKR